MSDACAIDIEALLAPISGPNPAGDKNAYSYRLRERLGELRVEQRPEDFDDATRPAQLQHADYPAIIRIGTEALASETKDLRIACHLIEAWTKTAGFRGLTQGFCLLRRLLDECWERLLPDVDDNDLDARAAPIANLLDDCDRGFCFPNSVRLVPIAGGQSVLSWKKLASRHDADAEQEIARARSVAGDELAAQKISIEAAIAELTALCEVLDRRLLDNAPSLANLRKALDESLLMATALLPPQAPASAAAANAADKVEPATSSGDPPLLHSPATLDVGQIVSARDEVYAQLTQAAATLARLEPHSPIPYLVRRAVELGKLPFPQLVQQLVREERILADLQREFGLQQTLNP